MDLLLAPSLFGDIQALADLALRLCRQIHHRLLHALLMYVKAPTPCQNGRSNISILTYFVPSVALPWSEDDDGLVT
jgi:hypothetical protein